MLRGHSGRRVKPKPPNGWVSGKNHPEPIRRRLRDATLWDRALIALFFFLTGAMATGGIYWYLSQPDTSTSSYRRTAYLSSIVTPLEELTGPEATMHFVLVCLAGGVVAAIAYVFVSLSDPYGTTAAAKADQKRKRDRFEFLKQAGYSVAEPEEPGKATAPDQKDQ